MKMFSLILLYALILTCKSLTALTASKIQDSTMTNSYKDDDDTSWIVKGQLIYDFAIKYKKIRQLSILWCNHKINLKLWRKHENNEKTKFILNRKHDEPQMVYQQKKQEQEEQNEYQKYENEQDQKFENQQPIHITKQQQQHQQEEEQKQQQEKYKIERKWQKQNRKKKQTRNFQRVNKKNNDNISGIITMLKILYNNSGKIAIEQNGGNESGSSTSSSSDDIDSRSDSSVSIKSIPIDSLLLSIDEDRNEKQKRSNRRSSSKRNGPSIKNKCKNKIVNETNEEYMKKKFLQILKSEDLHQIIVLDMSCGEDSLQILKMASDMELFNSSYHWLLISDYAIDYRYHPKIVNTTKNDTMKENNFVDENYKDNDVDVNDDVDDECKYEQSEKNKISSELIEFFDNLNINMNTEMILAKKNNINQSNRHNYILFDIWNPGWQFGGKLNITKVGIFSQYNGLQMYDWYKRTTTIVRRMNMKNVPIRCMIVVTNKFSGILENYLRDERDYHLDSMHRFNFALLNHVKDLFNFSFQLYRTNSWGYEHNGTYDGMIGALIRREIEIGGSPIFFLIERARLIDYTTHTWTARPCFIFRHPDKIHFIRTIFLEPFSNSVWISLVICGIMVILLLWKTIKFEESIYWMICNGKKQFKSNNRNCSCNDPEILWMRPSSYKKYVGDCNHCGGDGNGNSNPNRNKNGKSENYQVESLYSEFSISYVLFFIGTLCQQGVSYRSNLCSGRCLIISTLFLTFCINQFYSASIVGTLLMEKPKTMKTLRDLIDSPLNIIVEDILYNHDFFRRTTDPDAIELYRRKINSFSKDNVINIIKLKENDMENFNKTGLNMKVLLSSSSSTALQSGRRDIQRTLLKKSKSAWYNVENGLKLLKKGGYAFHVDVATAYKIIKETFTEREICELTEIQLFPPRKMINIVRKGSPLRKMITYGLRRTRESGLMDRQRKLWHSKKPRCARKIQPDDLKVDIQTLVSAVFILISGLISSIVILFLEVLYNLWQKSKK